MIIVAICDDNKKERTELCHVIEQFLQSRGIEGKIFASGSAEELRSVMECNKIRFDIVFLDIIMKDMDGMTCARLIRQEDKLVKIIFLTSSTDYVYEGYEVEAAGYLLKPANYAKLASVLGKAVDQLQDIAKESMAIVSGGGTQRVKITDILYLESGKNRVSIVLAKPDEKLIVYTKLDDFEQHYPSKMWIRTHKSFLVNYLYIEQYVNDEFVLRDGTVIPISRSYRDRARELFYSLLHNT